VAQQTASQTAGPYFRIGLIHEERQNDLVREETAGERISITGVVWDGNGEPVLDALVEIWQADANGIYNHPGDPLGAQAHPHFRGFGRAETRQGGYEFRTIKPGGRDGHAPYINLHVFARGMLLHAMTRMYFEDEAANAGDPVLSAVDANRRPTLIATHDVNNAAGYRFDIYLQGEHETVFFDPQ
jgi:protocatechuate 3,4-dioxygenase alpha subunit